MMDFSAITVLCVGDVMLDRYVYGEMERISPEAPVPVLRLTRTREMAGGVGNVASNILSLGGRAVLVGLIGEDPPGEALRTIVAAQGCAISGLVSSAARPTICKTRFIAAHQQVVRADEESRLALQPEEQQALCAAIDRHIGEASVLVLSDYGKGVCALPVLAHAIAQARARGIAVFVDPKSNDFSRYRGATCITPNARELAAAAGLPEDRNAARIAAEIGDVVPHPFQGQHDVHHADVSRARVLASEARQIEEPEDVQTMIQRDHNYIAAASQILSVVGEQLLPGACGVATAMQPDHNRPLLVIVNAGRPHIDAQAVLAGNTIVPGEHPGILVMLPAFPVRLRTDTTVLH